ncbi:MAG TPA: MFS transporter [Victivallales bacterium]|nr:MFS transporter [Victivallales bacterium]
MKNTDQQIKVPNYIFVFLAPLGMINLVFISPGLPMLAKYFNVSFSESHNVVVLFTLGYALGTLMYGPIANFFGRKKSLYFGVLLTIFGSLICLIGISFHSYSLLTVGRLLAGLGAGSGMVISFLVVNDVYKDEAARKAMGYCLIGLSLFPGVFNFIGGSLTSDFGWISSFYFMFFFNIFIFFLAMIKLPETYTPRPGKLKIKDVFINYSEAVRNKNLVISALMYGLCATILFSAVAYLPFIGIDMLKMSPFLFSICYLIIYLAYVLGCHVNNMMAKYYSMKQTIILGSCVTMLGGVMLVITYLTSCSSIIVFTTAASIVFLGLPLIKIGVTIFGISSHNDKANASSFFTFCFLMTGTVLTYFVRFADMNLLLTLGCICIVLMIISFILYSRIFMVKNKNKRLYDSVPT